MQFPESWLREFCNPPLTIQELADKLTMAGLEVEELTAVAPAFSQVVVGEIKACVQHPNADRLRVCQVDVGQAALLNIVCGAPNARVGIKIPCALVGAELPAAKAAVDSQPFKIKLGQLRGVESQGMLCSAKELGIAEGADAAQGLLELASSAVVGQSIREHLNLDDTLFTLKLTPNLAHCLSVYGVAREVAAITGAPLVAPKWVTSKVDFTDVVPVKIEAPELCGRFSGRIVRGVNFAAKTPEWMVDRLARCGQRSVNALVDISNYVMFELGRPSHIFDLDKIHGGLFVRWAKNGESLTLLNGSTVTLEEKFGAKVGVIADEQAVESLAGIMGGDATAVSESTQNIYIEAAFWYPSSIAGRSRRFNFSTDAGHRFERGVDPSTTIEHIERITQLVVQICGTAQTTVGAIDDHQPNVPAIRNVALRASRAAKVIGMRLTKEDCRKALSSLGLRVADDLTDDDKLMVTPPAYRFDLQIEEDLIEEVIRTIGYDRLPTNKPLAPTAPKWRLETKRSDFAVRRQLAALGYQETINFSFVPEQWELELAANKNPVRLTNPIASQMNVMRSSLLGSLLAVMKYNQDRKASDVRVFELGRVFLRDASAVDSDRSVKGLYQPLRVAGLASGDAQPSNWATRSRSADFFDVRADVEALFAPQVLVFKAAQHPALHPGRCASVHVNGQAIGFIGELHPKWKQSYGLASAPVLFELDLAAVTSRQLPTLQAVPKVPFVQRDLAVVVKESITHAQLMDAIASAQQALIKNVALFDVYRAKAGDASMASDEKSLAVRVTLGDAEATLLDSQIEAAMAAVLAALSEKLKARLR
ncbi:MAG: phenylalanine--tRNA ligase subunit beta [Cytophagales bacterium]|nr:phenylalanine--tRNA ligase subunit beta [Cytophagales bacterium]